MTYQEIVEKLTSTGFFSSFAGLYRMKKTMDYFGNPEERLACIHVAGTNGKGSVCAMLHGILKEAGYKVGLFTSPYLHCIRERIRINGEMISEEDMARIGSRVYEYCDKLYEAPNQFELLTIMALLYFEEMNCDLVILETGLGGTYDPTNIIPNPVVSVITNIGLDHCKILGDTIEKIAAAKAGIIKKNRDVVLYPSDKEALDVITACALRQDARIHYVDTDELHGMTPMESYEHFSYKGIEVTLNLLGEHQRKNCAVVLEVIELLNSGNYYISSVDMDNALRKIDWPGRMELLHRGPDIYLDGGHNPQCIEAAMTYFSGRAFAGRKIHIITGIVADKDYSTMLSMLSAMSDDIHFYRFANPRALNDEQYLPLEEMYGLHTTNNVEETLHVLMDILPAEDIILCIGSLYMADEIRRIFGKC